jgi:hypothetical protein
MKMAQTIVTISLREFGRRASDTGAPAAALNGEERMPLRRVAKQFPPCSVDGDTGPLEGGHFHDGAGQCAVVPPLPPEE